MVVVMLAIFGWCSFRAITRPFEGLLGLLAVTMINPGELWPFFAILHIERVLAALTVIGLFIRPERLVFPTVTKRLLIFWLVMFVTTPFSFWPGGTMSFALDFGRIIFYHFLVVNLVDTAGRFKKFVIVFALLLGWIAGGALWSYAHGEFDAAALRNGFERAQGLTTSNGNPNSLGLTLVAGLPVVALLFIKSPKKQKLVSVVIMVLSLIAILLTGSRTTFAILCLLIGVWMASSFKTLKFIPVILVLAMVVWTFIPQMYKDRYSAIVDITKGTKTDESYEEHRIAREAGWAMIKDYPILGVGAGQFAVAAGTKYWPGRVKLWMNPHNLYVQVPSELGIVGVIAWLGFLVPFIKIVLRLRKQLKGRLDLDPILRCYPGACIFALGALFIGGCFGHNLYRQTWYQMAALAAVLDMVVARTVAKGTEPTAMPDARTQPVMVSA